MNVPAADTVVALFRGAIDGRPAADSDEVTGLLLQLLRTNLTQWDMEDATRVPDGSDAVVASAKRSIDRLNLERHHLVERIDAAIAAAIPQAGDASPSTESPAMAFDRLSVLVIRAVRTERAVGSGAPDGQALAGRLPRLHHQLAELSAAIDGLLDDVRAGTRRFLPYEPLKMYSP